MKTFDLLLFAGNEPISELIRTAEWAILGNGNWSHVGVVLEGKYLIDCVGTKSKDLDEGKLYVWESTVSLTIPDVLTGKCREGVQIRDFDLVLKEYNGKIGVSPLEKEFDEEKIRETVKKIYTKYKGVSYVRNPFVLISGLCCCFRSVREETHVGVFCSEFVGEIYKELGLIATDLKTEDIVPVDFLGVDLDGMKQVNGTIVELKK